MSQIALSIKLSVSQESISSYERNISIPSAEILIKISEIFGVSIDYLLGVDDTKKRINEDELDSFETALISNFRRLPQDQKEIQVKIISFIADYTERRM